jgi:hypothetical protein
MLIIYTHKCGSTVCLDSKRCSGFLFFVICESTQQELSLDYNSDSIKLSIRSEMNRLLFKQQGQQKRNKFRFIRRTK